MEEMICPECGRKYKIAVDGEVAIVIPITPKPKDNCSICSKVLIKEAP